MTSKWHRLVYLFPAHRRAEVADKLQKDPNCMLIMKSCRHGAIDCFEAMERMGLEYVYDFPEQEQFPEQENREK